MKNISDCRAGDAIRHKKFGEGRIIRIESEGETAKWEVEFRDGIKKLVPTEEQLVRFSGGSGLTIENVKHAVREVLEEETGTGEIEMGEKWWNGKMILIPGREGMQPKEIPLNSFFHKIVTLRERLRVLEQRINNHELLDDVEKVNLQQYITRIYGTLTTFNVLFSNKKDHFMGEKHKG